MAYRLYTTYYFDPRPKRRAEMDFAIDLNTATFDRVFVLAENVGCPWWFHDSWTNLSARMRFADLLDVARVADPDDIVAIANCDVVLPPSALRMIAANLQRDQAYCLTRWEIEGKYTMSVWDVGYSQDAWIFRGPPRENIGGDFWFGVPGCDNRFSHELRAAGYDVRNPSKSVASLHLHASRERTATNSQPNRVPPPYLYLLPVELGAEQPSEEALTLEERAQAFRKRKVLRRR